jgi:hypothetical protein
MNSPYDDLKAAGHSPQKAAEIAIDVQRGDTYAIGWLSLCRASLPKRIDEIAAKRDAIHAAYLECGS